MIGRFLRWIGKECPETYFTRSARVLRTAAYLKEAGYAIGTIQNWNGKGIKPNDFRGVILVTGGTSDTDTYMEQDQGPASFPELLLISHYRFATVGAMLWKTLQSPCKLVSESFQDYFDNIQKDISERLEFRWKFAKVESAAEGYDNQIHAAPMWKSTKSHHGKIALRLSSFYFARAAEVVAPYYQRIAEQDVLEIVKQQMDRDDRTAGLESRLIEFRVLTVSILLAIVGQMGGPGFSVLKHSTMLSLQLPRSIRSFATEFETLITSGLSFPRVSSLLAHIHCGKPAPAAPEAMRDEDIYYDDTGNVGWRNGSYATLPALLLQMASGPSSSAIGFRCLDTFIGNVPVQKDGSIRSGKHNILAERFRDFDTLKLLLSQEQNYDSERQIEPAGKKIMLGNPVMCPPDVPLYLNIERPMGREEPVLGLCGRVNGESVGNVGLLAILRTVVQSFEEQAEASTTCVKRSNPDEHAHSKCLIVSASAWSQPKRKPTGEPHYLIYIPVLNDPAWAIFLSGEIESRLCLCCADCAVAGANGKRKEEQKFALIGYKG